jgi:peptidyl-prolyl cis-trans isomerase C
MLKQHKPMLQSVMLLTALIIAGCAADDISKSSQVLARVGDKEITTTYFDRQLDNLPESIRKLSLHGEGKRAILDGLINREILYNEAIKRKLNKDADLVRKLEDLNKELIVNYYLKSVIGNRMKVEDNEVEEYYNKNPSEYKERREIRISQIVVPDLQKANEITERLRINRDFGELAANYSTDKTSAEKNGDIGYFTYQALPGKVRDDLFRMGTGEVSKPYEMADGYEVYKITDRRTASFPLEKVREKIKLEILNSKFRSELDHLLAQLKKTNQVQLNERLLR